jgi:hypothetical protein
MGVLVMMLRSLAVAALTLAGSGVACAQSVYLYVAPGASVYVTPTPNGPYYNGAPAVYLGSTAGACSRTIEAFWISRIKMIVNGDVAAISPT